MILKQLSIRIEENNLIKIKTKVKNNEFNSISDFIRTAIKEKLKISELALFFDDCEADILTIEKVI